MSSYLIEGYEGYSEDYETFVDIENFEDYQISDHGNIFSKKSNRYLEPLLHDKGYLKVVLCKNGKRKSHYVHRLVLTSFIKNPNNKKCVDHINNIKTDNRICNLRFASYPENSYNKSIYKNNKVGCKGVSIDKNTGKFHARISFKGKSYHLGLFVTLEDAKFARCKKAVELFGDFLHDSERL